MPTGDPVELVAVGRQALAAGEIADAIEALTAAVQAGDVAQAHDVLGGIGFMTEDFALSRRHYETAFRGYQTAGEPRAAALCGTMLGHLHFAALGNEAAGRGWLQRSRRLLEREGRCVERGYLELALAACDVRDMSALERSAELALELATEFGDLDLQVRALADGGLALVSQGRLADGFARLDEAMVPISSGEVRAPMAAGLAFCAMLTACDRTGDLRRAQEWTRLCQELVLDHLEGQVPVLHAHCRIAYGSVLCTAGRWPEAETEILRALAPSATAFVAKRADGIARLAELRLQQGRLAEAAELLAPVEDRFEVCEQLARLRWARGEQDLAVAVIFRALGELVADRLRCGPLLALLVDVELARGDLPAAKAALSRLAATVDGVDCATLQAAAAVAAGRVAVADEEHEQAIERFGEALRHTSTDEHPATAAAARLDLAQALAATGQTPAAVSEARAALAVFERLGADRYADRAGALLRSPERRAAPARGTGPSPSRR